jgi:ribosomal protein S18 acetylase RimI-like enzyme
MQQINKNMINDAAYVLSRAFKNDPLFVFFFPDESTRVELTFYTFRFIAAHAQKKGFVCAVSPGFEGASIWLPFTALKRGLVDQVRFGALKMLFRQGKEAIGRQIMASEHMRAIHAESLGEPHMYLSTIGIDEKYRGKGFASELMRPGLEKADRESLPCYLDTHNEKNIGLYARYGFEIAAESVIPGSDVRHWAMIRK